MEIIKQAVVADNADELPKALSLYKQGLDYFLTGLKWVKNEKSKEAIKAKVLEYMARAEEINKALSERKAAPAPKRVSKVGGGRDGKSDDGDEEDDEEDAEVKKLEKALSSAIVADGALNIRWDDVAGLEGAKVLLKEAVIMPVKFPQLFTGKRKPWVGILLYGPPGTGKSYLAKAVATEAGASCFLSVSSSDLVSKYQGESEKLIKQLFALARAKAPSIIFIDEIDSLAGARSDGENESGRRIKTEFMVQMQGVGQNNEGVLVLGATNTPWDLDPAIRRRFDKRVYIALPEKKDRQVMLGIHIGDTPNNLTKKNKAKIAALTEGFSGSDIKTLVKTALYEPIRTCQMATHFKKVADPNEQLDYLWCPCSPGDKGATEMGLFDIEGSRLLPLDVGMSDFMAALKSTKATVGEGDLVRLEEWTKEFGVSGE
jgi:vacuolar protein-sorting-associated protein 4